MQYKIQSGNFAFLLHRLSGLLLIAYLLLHIFVLTSLYDPQAFAEEMEMLNNPIAIAVEYMLFLPILFHSINGIRLIIVEWTDSGSRNHKKMLIAVYGVSVLLATAMLIIFLNHKPYDKQGVDDYTKRAVEQVKR
jgi:succinate dehydrogenase / fumarate reductase cytochrome b subunit